MKLKLTLVLFLSHFNILIGQAPKTPNDYNLIPYSINDNQLGKINFYVTKKDIKKKKPLLVLLDGSGHLPLYSLIKKDDNSSEIYENTSSNYQKLANTFHVVLISKPGTPFLDSLNVNSPQKFLELYKPSKEYTKQLSLDWRVNSASKIIDFLTNKIKISKNEIIAIGYSEGGQVVPKLALKNKKITKIISIVGSGLNQFNDFITAERLKAEKGQITSDSAQTKIDYLYTKFEGIYKNPNATDKFWEGHTYKRWASFCKDIPLENMLKLDIPILLIAGGKDKNSPITGIDYVKLEFSRTNKDNLTYKVYPNCDHWFNDQELHKNRLSEMMRYVLKWIDNQ